jgi:L-ascorbate metabolism protein UlaG (beta-lactamase superfamily)
MKIKWLGHACFLITSDAGVRLITDPYHREEDLTYGEINESADIVTVSHDHFDHNNVAAVGGKPEVVKKAGTTKVKGIEFKGIPCYHDESGGQERGGNIIFCFQVDEVNICHLGDLGHLLSDEQLAEIGEVDILLIPVGGFFTIDAKAATEVCNRLVPKLVIPMHYSTDKCHLAIGGVDEFLQGKGDVSRLSASELEFKREELPATTKIIVLKSAL